MSGVELGLAIVGVVGVVDVAIEYTKILINVCRSFIDAEKEIQERCIRLQSNYAQMRLQLLLLDRVQSHLDEDIQNVQREVLVVLKSKLGTANNKFEGLVSNWSADSVHNALPAKFVMAKKKRSKYVLVKDNLDKSIDDVESWQRVLFNPTWFAMMKTGTQQLDQELAVASKEKRPGNEIEILAGALAIRNSLSTVNSAQVFLPPDRLKSARILTIRFSSAKLIQIKNESKWRLLDSTSDIPRKTVRDLAVRLKNTTPSRFGLLTCIGVVQVDEKKNEYNLVFRSPDSMLNPETLRARVMSKDSSHSLTERIRLVTQLAQAICSIHTFGLVHKSIRPENIIIFRDQESALGSAFLLGFAEVRMEEGPTRLAGDNDLGKNIYRHPQRQGIRLQDPYIMQHDIYSLGVCLLEIGLWTSFVEYSGQASELIVLPSYSAELEDLDNARQPEFVKSKLLTLAKTELPEKMGTKYSKIVETCLTCLDEGNEDFGDESEFQDPDGVLVTVRYIQKILMQISNISI